MSTRKKARQTPGQSDLSDPNSTPTDQQANANLGTDGDYGSDGRDSDHGSHGSDPSAVDDDRGSRGDRGDSLGDRGGDRSVRSADSGFDRASSSTRGGARGFDRARSSVGGGDSVGAGDSVGSGDSVGAGSSGPSGPHVVQRAHQLLQNLFHELFQTEESAALHPLREARRLGTVPPSDALRQCSEHARRVLLELPELAAKRSLPVSRIGQMVGRLFSNARYWFADRLIEPERSYRGTLLGLRHGVDLVTLIRDIALVEGDSALAEWCARWLVEREPLVEAVAAQLQWFAETPDAALGITAWEEFEVLLGRLSSLILKRMTPAEPPRAAADAPN